MKFRLLIVDDDEGIRQAYNDFFQTKGFCVDAAASGLEARSLLKEQKYGTVILDLVLEEMNGLDLVEDILEHNNACKIIVITGFGSVETAVECWHSGCSDFMEKPCLPDELLFAVERAFDRDEKARFDFC